MAQGIILASGSQTRQAMLRNAGVPFSVEKAAVDEEALRESLAAEGVGPRDMADALAEMKSQRVSRKFPGAFVIGSDQILSLEGEIMTKADTREEAAEKLSALRGKRHSLFSAAVIHDDGEPVWRHVAEAKLMMRPFSDDYLSAYLDRNWPAVSGSVGAYHIEGEGLRLFSHVSGDHFTILGMPLLPVLSYLMTRGLIDG
ncbi:MAG: Maf family protein [Pseudooceanicola sp.]